MAPEQQDVVLADLVPLVEDNASGRLVDTLGVDHARVDRLLAEAERVAHTIDREGLVESALAYLVHTLAPVDPDRAYRVATSLSDPDQRSWSLARLARELADTDRPRALGLADNAERVARSITGGSRDRQFALSEVACSVAELDIDRAERIARSITDPATLCRTQSSTVRALARTDTNRAEALARSIIDPGYRVHALVELARTLRTTEPERATGLLADSEQVACSMAGRSVWRVSALTAVAEVLAGHDPRRSAQLARLIPNKKWTGSYRSSVARALATVDPDRAERVARSIRDRGARASALAGIAAAQDKTDPGRAERLLDLTGQLVRRITNAGERAKVLVDVAQEVSDIDDVWAMDLLGEAERVTDSIIEEYDRQEAQTRLVEVLGRLDPDRAERVALSIADAHARSFALMNLTHMLLRPVGP